MLTGSRLRLSRTLAPALGALLVPPVVIMALAGSASAQPPSEPPAAPPTAASATAVSPAAASTTAGPEGAPATTPAPAPAAGNWYDKLAVDAFVDAYGSLNYNFPKPQAPIATFSPVGGNNFRALDTAQGFSVNWAGINAAYTGDHVGGTLGLRFGPGAIAYHAGTADATGGLQFVKQAYATWKPSDKLSLDFGKFDQPYGSEVADSQLNMNYTRSLLWWYMQPLFFTGPRLTYAATDQLTLIAFAANGWNNSVALSRGKAFGGMVAFKASDALLVSAGYVASREQPDNVVIGPTAGTPAAPAPPGSPQGTPGTPAVPATPTTVADVPNANAHWRHLIDLVVDVNATKELRLLLNGDYRTEDNVAADQSAVVYGGNLVARYSFTDAFYASLRGEFFHDVHGDVLLTLVPTDVQDATLTLSYTIASHVALMFDNRLDISNKEIFQTGIHPGNSKTQFTTTLGVIAKTN